jgi:hypothetical protein
MYLQANLLIFFTPNIEQIDFVLVINSSSEELTKGIISGFSSDAELFINFVNLAASSLNKKDKGLN